MVEHHHGINIEGRSPRLMALEMLGEQARQDHGLDYDYYKSLIEAGELDERSFRIGMMSGAVEVIASIVSGESQYIGGIVPEKGDTDGYTG